MVPGLSAKRKLLVVCSRKLPKDESHPVCAISSDKSNAGPLDLQSWILVVPLVPLFPTCRSPKPDRASVEAAFAATLSVDVADQRFIAKINQHGMVLIIGPAAEDIKTPVSRPG